MTPDPAAAHDDRDRATADEAASIPPATRDDIPVSWDERTILTTFLDYARATVNAKCAGIAEEDARRAPLPGSPLMTISGLVSHLRWVGYYWFGVHLLGGETTVRGPRRIPIARCGSPVSQLLGEYETSCAVPAG